MTPAGPLPDAAPLHTRATGRVAPDDRDGDLTVPGRRVRAVAGGYGGYPVVCPLPQRRRESAGDSRTAACGHRLRSRGRRFCGAR
jgi:hypothetical protein